MIKDRVGLGRLTTGTKASAADVGTHLARSGGMHAPKPNAGDLGS